jgi:hypothetical protein
MFTDQYGNNWAQKPHDLQIELRMIRNLYHLQHPALAEHYLKAHKLIWPEDEQHRWFTLGITGIVENKVTCLLGCASSGKSYLMAAHALITFFVFPKTSFALISSTTIESLKDRIWGRGIAFLFNRAKRRHGWLPGYVLESSLSILDHEVDDEGEEIRETASGIKCVPCKTGGRFIGLARFQGIKPPNSPGKNDGILSHYGDESATMERAYLDAYTNWMVNKSFKGVQAGNPWDISDPLCTASEPVGGWDSFVDSGATQTWRSKWYDAFCIAFDGRDTPNKDNPENRYHFLASSTFVDELIKTHQEDSLEVYMMGIGKPSRGMVSNRVITMNLCEKNKAFEDVVWRDDNKTKVYAIDPAYGGGDRCIGMEGEIGTDFFGKEILSLVGEPEIIPIKLNTGLEAEEQIAAFAKQKSDEAGIPPQNFFYDSFGRGTLGNAFAKVFNSNCPNPVDSGQMPTDRPVRFDLFVEDKDGNRRLKTCREHYSKFVTELWFSTREAIESQQIRNLSKTTANEGQMRMYKIVAGNRTEVETKEELKKRLKRSPDEYDTFAVLVEGARRLGFKITRIGAGVATKPSEIENLLEESLKVDSILANNLLTHA